MAKAARSRRQTFISQLYEAAGDIKPKNITIDTLSRAFAGNEIDRRRSMPSPCTCRLGNGGRRFGHSAKPSKPAGIASVQDFRSTAWHGAFRFRQYLKGIKPEDAANSLTTDVRELAFKKNQYGPTANTVVLRYQRGLFLPEQGGSLKKLARQARVR